MAGADLIGQSIVRPDAHDKVTGGRGFPVNVSLPGMLHAKLLRSPYPHARVLSIDTSEAEKLPGVKAVLTAADVPQIPFSPVYFCPTESKGLVQDMLILSDTVRYAGQPVAAVAATSEAIAERALELIDVDYEELPTVFDPEEAMQEGAVQLHESKPGNVAVNPAVEFGDVEAGFAEADHIFEGVYQTQRVHTCYMEPRVCVVDCDKEGRFTVHSSMQHIHGLREKLAYALGIPEGRVTVIKPPYIGGGFGGKLDLGYIEPIAALFSERTGWPVRIEQTRYEDFITTARHAIKVYLKTGIKNDGTITAREARSVLDTGAHATHGAEVIMVHGMFGVLFPYRCANKKWEGFTVYTNNTIGGGFRGYGCPQGCFAVESQIDEICEELNLDPIEFRLKNAYRKGDPHPFNPGWTLNSYGYEEALTQGAERIGWSERSPAGSSPGVKKRGIGVGTQGIWVSGCMGFPDIYEHTGAIIKLNPDGTADLASGTVDLGAGQNVTLCQIAAAELGLEAGQVRMSYADTGTVPFDAPTHASRATYSSGLAVQAAAAQAKQRLLEIAAWLMEASPDDLDVSDGKVFLKSSPETSRPVTDVIKVAESPFMEITDQGPQPSSPPEFKGTIMGMSSLAPPENPSPATAMFAEVEVDTETGVTSVLRCVYAHDLGKLINPNAAEGQVEGGMQQGIGYALMENLVFDPETGACLASDFLDYKMPTAVEMPRSIESIFIETNEPSGPFGAKSLAEQCVTVPAAAIAAAVYNAIGVRIKDLPITPEKVLRALGKLN
jgi:xanthine dehydrogenase molybdenum-binding subunit